MKRNILEAASTSLNHKLPGAYALQWQVIRDLRQLGVQRYNLWGIAPHGAKTIVILVLQFSKLALAEKLSSLYLQQDIVINGAKYLLNLVVEKSPQKRLDICQPS